MSSQLPSARACFARCSAVLPRLAAAQPLSRTKAQHFSSSSTSQRPSDATTRKSASRHGTADTSGKHAKPSDSRSKFPSPLVIGKQPPSRPHSTLPPAALTRATSSGTCVVWSTLSRRTPPHRKPTTTRESPAQLHHKRPPVAATTTAVLPPCSPSRRVDSWHSLNVLLSASPGQAGHNGLDQRRPGNICEACPATSEKRCPSKTAQSASSPRQSMARRSWLFELCHNTKLVGEGQRSQASSQR